MGGEDEFILYLDDYSGPGHSEPFGQSGPGWKTKVLPGKGQAWKQLKLPAALRQDRVDAFHSLTSTIPLRRPCPTVVTICDLFFEVYPEFVPVKSRLIMRRLFSYAARHADRIIAISENTKRDIIQFYDVPDSKIAVSYPGLNPFFRRLEGEGGIKNTLAKYKIDSPYVLHVGSLSFTRNISGLMEAFALLTEDYPKMKLVLVGGSFWGFQLAPLLEKHGLENQVIAIDYMPNEDLRAVYNEAQALILPSFFEGFGLPIIEAMACGTPVVASSVGAMKEAAGDAGLLVDPHDPAAMAEAMRRILKDDNLQEQLIEKGLAQAAKFTWRAAAEEALEVYHSLA